MAKAQQKITVESVEPVFGLHWFVGVEDRLFEEEGLEVEIVSPPHPPKFDRNDPRRYDPQQVSSFNYQNYFEQGQCDAYRSCEWGQIRRTYDQSREGPIVSKRPAVVCQSLYVRPESPINAAVQLANKEVGVQFHQGSHYVTLGMLEGLVRPEDIKVVHAGVGYQKYEALEQGEVDAACLHEPYSTLADRNGFKKLCEAHYLGLENLAAGLEPDVKEALMRALRKAVAHINADKRRYLHILLQEMPEHLRAQLSLEDFDRSALNRLRHVDPEPYTPEEFDWTSEWMKKWNLVGQDASYDKLVAG